MIFVYNASPGILNSALHALHKILSPKTYPCNLCAVTHGATAMKKEWADFIKKLPAKSIFLHKDEWEKKFQRADELPAAFVKEGGEIKTLIGPETMRNITLEELKAQILEKTADIGARP